MKRLLRLISNKFFLATVAFAVWMLFFDANDYVARKQRNQTLAETNANISYLKQEIERMEKAHLGLTTNPNALEKYAREEYRMKRDNEDLYLLED